MSHDLFRLGAHELHDLVVQKEASCVEVTEACLRRIDEVDEFVGAFLSVDAEGALEHARALDAQIGKGQSVPPLAGVPIAVKDNFCTRRGLTTCASKILSNFESPYDGTVIQKLREAGAILVGKLNMDEFAMGSSTENSSVRPTKNPWDLSRVPGGSSGGAAAAVSSMTLPLSFGSDTGGSIRQPAAFSGCMGMKPTYGRVSRYGLVAFASSLDQIGPLTRNTRDMALALNAISGRDPLDATSADVPVPDFTQALEDNVADLTIGLPREYFTDALGDEMRQLVERTIDFYRSRGARVEEISLPHTEYAVATYYIICTAEASANLARFDGVRYGYRAPDATDVEDLYTRTKSEGFGAEVQRRIILGTYALSSGYYDAYYLKAQKVRNLIRQDFVEAFKTCDLILTPTTPTPAFSIGEKTEDPMEMYLGDIYTVSVNLAGLPGMSIPCGLTSEKLPAGFQLLAKPFDEATLLRAAYVYEQSGAVALGDPPLA